MRVNVINVLVKKFFNTNNLLQFFSLSLKMIRQKYAYIKNYLVDQQTHANNDYVDAFSYKNRKAEHLIKYNCQDPILLAESQMLADK